MNGNVYNSHDKKKKKKEFDVWERKLILNDCDFALSVDRELFWQTVDFKQLHDKMCFSLLERVNKIEGWWLKKHHSMLEV